MIKPQKLSAGDTVALVSLSSGMAGEALFMHKTDIGRSRLEKEFGLHVVVMPNTLKGIQYLDENPKARADDLMQAFCNPKVKAIISMIGGDDTIRILPFIDDAVFRQNPKIFMGYSDTTINHLMMYRAGLMSYYGPCVLSEFAENGAMHPYTKRSVRETLFEKHDSLSILSSPEWTSDFMDWANPDNNQKIRPMTKEHRGFELIQGKGIVQGTLLGGCLDVFPMVVGTELWPAKDQWKGKILFLETSEDYPSPSTVKYVLRGLAAQGVIGSISGILFGKPKDEKYYHEYKEIIRQVVGVEAARPDMPVLYNMNFGHTAPMSILPYGILSEINCNEISFRFLEPAVS